MRQISSFVIVRTDSNPYEITKESFEHGMIYPAPHTLIFKMDESDLKYTLQKMRPIAERCAVVRDSRLNNIGYGIVVNSKTSTMNATLSRMVGMVIKSIVDDIGISQYEILSDEANMDRFIDTFELPAIIATIPSIFNKRI